MNKDREEDEEEEEEESDMDADSQGQTPVMRWNNEDGRMKLVIGWKHLVQHIISLRLLTRTGRSLKL